MELIVRARRGKALPFRNKVAEWFASDRAPRDLFELEDLGFEYDTVKVDMRVGKNQRTLDFAKKQSTPIFDLTKDVQFGKNGLPTFESLLAATASLAADFATEMYA